jgi:hypothetical protein
MDLYHIIKAELNFRWIQQVIILQTMLLLDFILQSLIILILQIQAY